MGDIEATVHACPAGRGGVEMKDYLNCAYFRGYRTGAAISQRAWTVTMPDDEMEELLVNEIPHTPEMFKEATGLAKPDATEEEIVTALRWWAKGYCKGRAN